MSSLPTTRCRPRSSGAPAATLTDSFTITRDTSANVPPVASFTSSCTTLTCTFNGSGSSDSDGTISDYAWSFGDGAEASGVNTSHTYAAGASYSVTLTVTDTGGQTGSTTRNVTVTAPPATTYVSDQFTRTAASGLGTAPTGWRLDLQRLRGRSERGRRDGQHQVGRPGRDFRSI